MDLKTITFPLWLETLLIGLLTTAADALYEYVHSGVAFEWKSLLFGIGVALLNFLTSWLRKNAVALAFGQTPVAVVPADMILVPAPVPSPAAVTPAQVVAIVDQAQSTAVHEGVV